MRQRIEELDYLKGIFIILMITFHLVYIGDSYPYAKRIVHTFHMPGFLIISGYLMNISKPWRDFIKTMLGYAIPYCIMESGYIVMASDILAFVLLAIHPQNLLMEQSVGVLIVYLAIVGFIFSYSYIGQKNSSLLLFLGRNTMPLFLFSPIFTFLCKPLVPVLQFEPTGLLFLLLSLIICITGNLSIESVMNWTGLSQYFYYKR